LVESPYEAVEEEVNLVQEPVLDPNDVLTCQGGPEEEAR